MSTSEKVARFLTTARSAEPTYKGEDEDAAAAAYLLDEQGSTRWRVMKLLVLQCRETTVGR